MVVGAGYSLSHIIVPQAQSLGYQAYTRSRCFPLRCLSIDLHRGGYSKCFHDGKSTTCLPMRDLHVLLCPRLEDVELAVTIYVMRPVTVSMNNCDSGSIPENAMERINELES